MLRLAAAGSEQTRKTYGRHGVTGPMYGVSFAELGKLHKAIKQDQALAQQLWDTGNHDARVLATMVADVKQMDVAQLETWLGQIDNAPLSDLFATMVARSPLSPTCIERWRASEAELTAKVCWNLVASRAIDPQPLDDSWFEPWLTEINAQIHQRPDRIRHAMNQALIAIGSRSSGLEQQARIVAKAIGKVQVDHGQTACKTPDAISYLERTLAKKGHVVKA
ncbi:MAG: DNA alkylation repair protein [Candidatus Melainabacteria bacterium HGW-Melainabacteria-1]|nr:MAG: DNA alkylation repair protein [Candidatus Melainabacteria bacterium HGW-Melainabacteria-1]